MGKSPGTSIELSRNVVVQKTKKNFKSSSDHHTAEDVKEVKWSSLN